MDQSLTSRRWNALSETCVGRWVSAMGGVLGLRAGTRSPRGASVGCSSSRRSGQRGICLPPFSGDLRSGEVIKGVVRRSQERRRAAGSPAAGRARRLTGPGTSPAAMDFS